MRRGEIRSYSRPSTPGRPREVVLLSSDGINDSPRPWLLGVELRERDPGDLLAIPVPERGWAYAGDLMRLYRAWVGEARGALGPTTLSRLEEAVRAALDL